MGHNHGKGPGSWPFGRDRLRRCAGNYQETRWNRPRCHSPLSRKFMAAPMIDRRSFLEFATAGLLAYPRAAGANVSNAFSRARNRSLSFYSLHTSERLKSVYWEDGSYIPESLSQINHVLRDHRSNETCEIATVAGYIVRVAHDSRNRRAIRADIRLPISRNQRETSK